MKRLIVVALLGVMALSLWACGNSKGKQGEETAGPVEEASDPATDNEQDIASESTESAETSESAEEDHGLSEASELDDSLKNAINSFNWKLYDKAGKNNVFYSAYSIESALAMVDLGADGNTKADMEEMLGIEDLQSFSEQYKLFREQTKSESAKLTTANSIWIDKSYSLSDKADEAFIKPADFYYGGELKTVDFKNDSESVKVEIGDWVKENTEGLIPDYDSSVDKETVADILNAVYFYGEWQDKFAAEDTYPEEFNAAAGKKNVDMMHLNDSSFRYLEEKDGITAVALPYSGTDVEMDVLMSSDPDKKLEDVFSSDKAEEILTSLDESEVTSMELAVPKFSMDLRYENLTDALKELGIASAFGAEADFSKIADNLAISDISHRAKVEVDEEGSRAAAVTEVMMKTTAMLNPMDKVSFKVDRPFVFVIRDKASGVILFTGRVNDIVSEQ